MNWKLIIFLTLQVLVQGCNPLKDPGCFVQNTALARNLDSIDPETFNFYGNITKTPTEIHLTLQKQYDNPRIESKFSILYGKVECDIMAAKGQGIITSFYLQSDDLDEIDIAEVFGGNPYEFQSNFFIKGNTTTWDRGGYHPLPNPLENFNKYTVEWTPEEIIWFINGEPVRKLPRANPYGVPHLPMGVKFSLWAGGDRGNAEGTILWAGGVTDYHQLPYVMRVRNLAVQDYSTGRYYSYGHRDGEWVGLHSEGGEVGASAGLEAPVLGRPVELDLLPMDLDTEGRLGLDLDLASRLELDPGPGPGLAVDSAASPLGTLVMYFVLEVVVFSIWF